jgi:hypothetical protein
VQKTGVDDGFETVDDVPEDGNCFLLWQFLTLLKEVVEVTLVAELGDYVTVVNGAVNVVAFEDVDVVDSFEGIDFAFEHLASGAIGDGLQVDDLNRDLFFGFLVDAPEHARAEAFADEVVESVRVVFDFLSEFVVVGGEAHWNEFSNCKLTANFQNDYTNQLVTLYFQIYFYHYTNFDNH